jgi:hypothetical protein
MRNWWNYVACEWIRRKAEKLVMGIAWRLPKRLVMWCAYRVGAHATQGKYGNTVVPELTFMDAMQRWEA